jgi:hypothetical protein
VENPPDRRRHHPGTHVRICGSPGWVTAQGDPAKRRPKRNLLTVPFGRDDLAA